jgi:hypothetical protein
VREATVQDTAFIQGDDSTKDTLRNNITPGTKEVMNRAALRNILRKQKGFSRQTRSREFPNYQPYENNGGGMNRHYERAAQKKADSDLLEYAQKAADGVVV